MDMFQWLISGGIFGIIGLILKNNYDSDRKIARTYERLDEVKQAQENRVNKIREEQVGKAAEVLEAADKRYTNKDVCMTLHKQMDAKLTEICVDVKTLIRNGRERP